jgi:hypothetical protein
MDAYRMERTGAPFAGEYCVSTQYFAEVELLSIRNAVLLSASTVHFGFIEKVKR